MKPFAAPQMFWLLLIVAAPLVGFFWWAWRKRQQLITQFISSRLLDQLKVGVSPARQKARLVLFVAAVIFLIVALARPQWGVTREEARQRGLDIIVAIDTSNSMLAEDVTPNRLTRAKLAALDLMHKAKTDRLGLVAFAGDAFLECPLTLDDAAFSQSVDSLDTKTISQGGTAIGEAIDEARKGFKDESDNHRVLVLFTDGEDHDSAAVSAAEKAAKDGMVIFTIGIGTAEGEQLRVRDENGRMDYIRDEQGNPVKSHLNEELLQQIARTTKEGFYLPLRGTKTMDTLYDHGIAPLPKSEKSVRMFQSYREQYHWPLGIALVLLLAEMFLPDRKRRRSRSASGGITTSVGNLTETVAILLLLALPGAAWGSPASALREYNQGNYQDAFRDYNQLLEKKKDDPRLHFNAGAAAYQSHQFEEATKQLNAALASPDLQLQQRAYYNLGNSLYRMGQQMPDASKKQEAWENAVKQYESASKLNQQDSDAKFNQQFVQQQLEELKKQQQQQQSQSDKNSNKQNQKKDQKDQKDQNQSQNNQQQNSQQNQQNQQQDKSQNEQNQDSQANNQDQQKKSGQDQEKKQNQSQADKQKSEDKNKEMAQNQASGEQKDKSDEEAKREAAMMAAGEMTPQQAQQLLDAAKDDEQVLRLSPTNKDSSLNRPYKNW